MTGWLKFVVPISLTGVIIMKMQDRIPEVAKKNAAFWAGRSDIGCTEGIGYTMDIFPVTL